MISPLRSLLPPQRKAIEYIRETAITKSVEARETLRCILARAGLPMAAFDTAMQNLQKQCRVAVHFHPERLTNSGLSVAEGLLQEGVYKSQFETGISSGSPTAFLGGERDVWEKHLFGGAYHAAGCAYADRPKYGSLDFQFHPDGPSPRFGSCYFLLRPQLSQRCTFTFGGSQEVVALERTGTLSMMEPVMAALFNEVEQGSGALGVPGLTVIDLLSQMTQGLSAPFQDPAVRPLGKTLDSFIEVQVHGTIALGENVERLVADPSFKGGPMEVVLQAICARYAVPLYWHPGFILPVRAVPETFRGYAVKPLAQRIAGTGFLDAAKIGASANSLILEPNLWKDWGDDQDTLTQFRRLWHLLVLYGSPNQA